MVGHTALKLRMALAGSILFAIYAALAGVVYIAFGGGTVILAVLLLGSLGLIAGQYKFGKWMALRSVRAEDMPEGRHSGYDYGRVHRSVEQLSDEMGIDKPRLMVAEMGMPNAFAVGRKGAGVVVVSTEIMQMLDHDELEGVLAHELAHIKNRDVVIMVIGQAIASIVGLVVQFAVFFAGDNELADLFLGMILGNIAQLLVMTVVLAISRYREYVADEDAATYTRNPDAMARALEKISKGAQGRELRGEDTVSALCIFGSSSGLVQRIFSTHPPTEKRISRLRGMNAY
jgi:heat shock protein HtpX